MFINLILWIEFEKEKLLVFKWVGREGNIFLEFINGGFGDYVLNFKMNDEGGVWIDI